MLTGIGSQKLRFLTSDDCEAALPLYLVSGIRQRVWVGEQDDLSKYALL
jgi:hypothetical protein